MDCFGHRTQVARKSHSCAACRWPIEPGTFYPSWFCVDGGDGGQVKVHSICNAIMKYEMTDRREHEWLIDEDMVVELLRDRAIEEFEKVSARYMPGLPESEREHLRRIWNEAKRVSAEWEKRYGHRAT